MNLDCVICGKTSFTDIGGVPVCEECFYSIQENDYSDIKENVDKLINKPVTKFDIVEEIVCNSNDVDPSILESKTKKREIVLTRQLCHYFSVENKLGSLSVIGSRFGNKDHATVIYSCKTINNLKETNKAFLKEFNEIKEKIDKSF